MKKILAGIMGIAMIVAVVSGAAYAAFSSQATVSNVSFATGNATLQVYNGTSYGSDWTTTLNFTNMYPGYTSGAQDLWLKNNSSSPISLSVVMQLTNGGPNWGNGLENFIQVKVNNSEETAGTDWQTLSAWNAGTIALPGTAISQNEQRLYHLYVKLDSSASNSEANLPMAGVGFTLTGTQI